MILIKIFDRESGLPKRGKVVSLIFCDTVFGWFRLPVTDAEGKTTVNTSPGFARVYVAGELLGEYWVEDDLRIHLNERKPLRHTGSYEARPQVQGNIIAPKAQFQNGSKVLGQGRVSAGPVQKIAGEAEKRV